MEPRGDERHGRLSVVPHVGDLDKLKFHNINSEDATATTATTIVMSSTNKAST